MAGMEQALQLRESLHALHAVVQASRPVFETLREVLALQWALGNLAMVVLLAVGLKAYFFARKAIRAFNQDYTLPRRWLIAYTSAWVICMTVFNALPSAIKIPVELPREVADLAGRG